MSVSSQLSVSGMNSVKQGKVVIISGPSGAGKTTVVRRLLAECHIPLVLSVSATTRTPRPGERDGVDYHFLSPQQFQAQREAGQFLECFEVFGSGKWYGTLQREVATGLAAGKWVLLEIDVQGALKAIEAYPQAITIFVHSGPIEELERRLRGRNTESEETILRRLAVARQELALAERYKHQVLNESVDQAVKDICQILQTSGD